ncbi:MAG: hypothetical protein ISR58_19590 [Anaerolineales bacterium]|nr:hypothetical protein [Anaerolineales bacterium]
MSIKFEILDEGNFLKVESSGVCKDLNQLKEYVLAIQNAALALDQDRVFVDETHLEYKLSTMSSFNSGRFVSGLKPQPKKIAVLCRQEGWKDAKFWETVAVNRGTLVKVFRDRESAREWICS